MTHPNLTWYCAECGYLVTGGGHHCPPDPQAVISTLVNALPRNAPSPNVKEEIERVSMLLREHRPDALEVDATTLRWLLAARSYLENATETLSQHRAVISAAQEEQTPPPSPDVGEKTPDAPRRPWYQHITVGYVVKQDAAPHRAYAGARPPHDSFEDCGGGW